MRASSVVFPFRSTFRRLELDKRWWHRLCVVIFFAALFGATSFTVWVVYAVFAPPADTMPDILYAEATPAQVNAEQGQQQNGSFAPSTSKQSTQHSDTPIDLSAGILENSSPTSESGRQGNPIQNVPTKDQWAVVSEQKLDKTIEMPDGSMSHFPATTSDDSIRARWNHAKTHQTLLAIMWAALFAIVSAVFFSYLLQGSYRVLLYVIYGDIAQAHNRVP